MKMPSSLRTLLSVLLKDGLYVSIIKGILKQLGLFCLGAIAVGLVRLFLLPGGTRRRKRLSYLIANFGKPGKNLPPIPPTSKLSEIVTRVMGLNPGTFTLQGSNTYVVGTGSQRILIDTGDGKNEYIQLLKKVLEDEKASITHVIITHEHEDHVGGIPNVRREFPQARIWKLTKYSLEKDPSGVPYDGKLENGTTIHVHGATVRAVLTPGHTADHVSLVLEEEGSIFTGDCVLGSGTAVFDDLHQYVGSLRILLRELGVNPNTQGDDQALPRGAETKLLAGRLYPGHGLVVEDGPKKINQYISHRQLREDQILNYLSTHAEAPTDVAEIVDHVYADQNLSWVLRRGAKRSVIQHLFKLLKEGKVVKVGKLWQVKSHQL
mmetsp:Transcript_13151/g.21336  ORF Transcript_13151/g.21336 Transcript_13151/m.21336 type:complete len:378 (+) Transcript_13151:976-2109(+)